MNTIEHFLKPQKQLAVLIDPDKLSESQLKTTAQNSQQAGVDLLFVGVDSRCATRPTQISNIKSMGCPERLSRVTVYPSSYDTGLDLKALAPIWRPTDERDAQSRNRSTD